MQIFVDLDINRKNGAFVNIYLIKDKFSFFVVSKTHISSNILPLVFFVSKFSDFPRIARSILAHLDYLTSYMVQSSYI